MTEPKKRDDFDDSGIDTTAYEVLERDFQEVKSKKPIYILRFCQNSLETKVLKNFE